jgi:hypothetical protein
MARADTDQRHLTTDPASPKFTEEPSSSHWARIRPWLNWTLALLAALGAAAAVLFGLGVLMSYDACTDEPCKQPVLSGTWLEVWWFAGPLVAAVAIAASFFTARRRYGILVPLCAWALIGADVGLLASYAQP